jgi:Transposase DDE domain
MIDNAVAIYCFLDDYMKAINHREDKQCQMNDAEVLLTAIMAGLYFGGHHERCLQYMKEHGLCRYVLSKSRFNRRLHAMDELMYTIFHSLGDVLKQFNTSMEYVMDSFPVKVCHNIRIPYNHLLPLDEQYRGKCVAKREYFYGFKVQVIATIEGVPVEFAIVPGSWSDARAMHVLPMQLPEGCRNISDSGYTNYQYEDLLMECDKIWHDSVRKSNSKRKDPAYRTYYKNTVRKIIENVFSRLTANFPKKIHATSIKGFLLKIKFFIYSFTFSNVLNTKVAT